MHYSELMICIFSEENDGGVPTATPIQGLSSWSLSIFCQKWVIGWQIKKGVFSACEIPNKTRRYAIHFMYDKDLKFSEMIYLC